LAAEYNRQGADELVFYDITASAEDRGLIMDVLHRAAGEVFIPLTVGGGVSTTDQIRDLLRAGADKVSVNTQAVLNPDLIAQGADRFGSQCIVLSMDVLWNAEREFYEIVTHGGRKRTGMDAVDWACKGVELGAGELVVNSIDADGTRDGYELRLTRPIAEAVSVPVVASGVAGNVEHMYRGLSVGGTDAALAARRFHSGEFTAAEAKRCAGRRAIRVSRAASSSGSTMCPQPRQSGKRRRSCSTPSAAGRHKPTRAHRTWRGYLRRASTAWERRWAKRRPRSSSRPRTPIPPSSPTRSPTCGSTRSCCSRSKAWSRKT